MELGTSEDSHEFYQNLDVSMIANTTATKFKATWKPLNPKHSYSYIWKQL